MLIRLLPALIFLGLCTLLTVSLWSDKDSGSFNPMGKSFPSMEALTSLNDTPIETPNATASYRLVNLFASWCVPCIVELPTLQLAQDKLAIPVIGIAWKDDATTLDRWLDTHGNPFNVVYDDTQGAFGIEVGIRGIPETYLINANNDILFHHRGPLMPSHLDDIKQAMNK